MIQYIAILVPFLFSTASTTENPRYQYETHASCTVDVPSCTSSPSVGYTYYSTNKITFEFDASFNNSDDWLIDNLTVSLEMDLYGYAGNTEQYTNNLFLTYDFNVSYDKDTYVNDFYYFSYQFSFATDGYAYIRMFNSSASEIDYSSLAVVSGFAPFESTVNVSLVPYQSYINNYLENFIIYTLNEDIQANLDREYNRGYTDGYNHALDSGSTAATIFAGILSVGLLPINVFLAMLNFEVFGINIGGFVAGILTICIIVILLRTVLGGKKSDD